MLPTEAECFKENLVLGCINKSVPVYKLCELYNTTRKTIRKWVKRYRKLGYHQEGAYMVKNLELTN